jgi:quercetin dioxygenase-like cupin family protein
MNGYSNKLRSLVMSIVLGLVLQTTHRADNQTLPDPLEAGWLGKKVCELLHEDEKQRIVRCTFPPGVGHEKHYHDPHFGYTLAGGKVRITDAKGTREATIKTGDTHLSNGTPWHEIVNIGESTIVYLLVEAK